MKEMRLLLSEELTMTWGTAARKRLTRPLLLACWQRRLPCPAHKMRVNLPMSFSCIQILMVDSFTEKSITRKNKKYKWEIENVEINFPTTAPYHPPPHTPSGPWATADYCDFHFIFAPEIPGRNSCLHAICQEKKPRSLAAWKPKNCKT